MPLSASQHFVILSTVNLFPQARHSRTIIHLGRVIVEESKKEKKFLERQILPGTPNTKSIVAQNLPFLGFKGQATSKLKLLLGLNEVAFRPGRIASLFMQIHCNQLRHIIQPWTWGRSCLPGGD